LKKFLFSAALLLLIASQAFAQYYYIGEEPSGVKWQIAKSGHFSLIFPYSDSTAAGKVAKRYLNLMELNYGSSADSLGLRSGLCNSFPMVLHTYNAKGNGVTVWAPRQIDFYGIPSAYSTYPQKWEEQLVLHEGRHAWQIAHFTKGIYKYLYWFMGDQITGGASGIYPSRWMLEGDAVVAETERSNAGRGRSGSFLAYYLLDTRFQIGAGIKGTHLGPVAVWVCKELHSKSLCSWILD
jgi:hypothetical protein